MIDTCIVQPSINSQSAAAPYLATIMSSHIASLVPSPIITDLPPTLSFLSNPISEYYNAAPPYNNAALGALLFTPPLHAPRLLLLQRCMCIGLMFLPFVPRNKELTPSSLLAGGMDPHAFSDCWQIPSGSPRPTDPTMLHALARIVFDETGLRLTSVSMMSGAEVEHAGSESGKAKRMRMLFMIEVAELGLTQLDYSPFGKNSECRSQEQDINSVPIALNLVKYRQHTWSTEKDLKELINSGLYPVEERAQYRMMLEAFIFHNQNLAYLDSLNHYSQSASSSHGLYT